MSTTSLKISDELKQTIQFFAEEERLSAHAFMLRTLEDEVRRRKQRADFLADAEAAAADIDAGGPTYALDDVFDYVKARLHARATGGPHPTPPNPVRGRGAMPVSRAKKAA